MLAIIIILWSCDVKCKHVMMHGLMSHDLYSSVVLVKLSSVSGNFPQLSVLHVATIAQTDKKKTHTRTSCCSFVETVFSFYIHVLRFVAVCTR